MMASCMSFARLAANGCFVAACWTPLLGAATVLFYLGITAQPSPACEVPLKLWALCTGATLSLMCILLLANYFASACALVDSHPSSSNNNRPNAELFTVMSISATEPKSVLYDPKQKILCRCGSRALVARFDHTVSQSNPVRTCFLVIISLVSTFLVVWISLGAFWLFPLHDKAHHCDAALFSISFYMVLAAIIGTAATATLSCVFSFCACIFAMSVGAALSTAVDAALSFFGVATKTADKRVKASSGTDTDPESAKETSPLMSP